ncbi:Beta-glucoside kinase [Listeria grayi]|uniref:ROK family protein n=1 Tax=Listeria grayi FSL F6-1183 TaxID=1265827 RepID=A0A829R8L5_LISGR|nr:ROK family protein [Listeria grayi]EUJ28662.1 ROK family protein [Listeria grayi FSL F6-1183]VEI36844.1 Beta-glucoside kinase [Listeria grayi]
MTTSKTQFAAFDIGGTALKMGVVLPTGEITAIESKNITAFNGQEILDGIKGWVATHPEVTRIAISAPGYVNPETGLITMGGAIRDFDDFNILEWIEKEIHLPASIENDANCALLAEKWLGAAQELDDFLCLTIGTGIGGGIFSSGKLIRGGRFRAGEFGYMFSSRPGSFSPGSYTLNQTATMHILRKQYAEQTGKAYAAVTGEEIFAGYDNHDPVCIRLVENFYNDICAGLYNLIYLFDPTHIFIGGGITSRPTFMQELQEKMDWFGLRDTILLSATHKNQAGLLGAVYHHLSRHKEVNV